jgi:hypothetical protein
MINKIAPLGFKILNAVKAKSPEILIGVGILGVVGGVVLACKATTKIDPIIDDIKDDVDFIHDCVDPDDQGKELVKAYVKGGAKLAKEYLPAFLLIAGGCASFVGSHNILRGRLVAVGAAYKYLESQYENYRERVVEELGEDKDNQFRLGIKKEKISEKFTKKDGTTGEKTRTAETVDPETVSDYAVWFDARSSQYWADSNYNKMFLQSQQAWFNDMLYLKGHVFLNEVYDALGLPRTPQGQVVGWTKAKDTPSEGDGYIDFGLDAAFNRNFLNGDEPGLLLDFNVDGVMWDSI